MARELLITQSDVNAVADRIQAAGGKPTARAVREALGAGSMATVLKCLQVWQGKQAPHADTPSAIPPQLERLLAGFVAQEVAAAKAAVEEDLATAQQANGDLIVESERQAAALTASEAENAALRSEGDELRGRLAQLSTELETQRQAAEGLRSEVARQQVRLEGIPRLEDEVARLQAALDQERSARAAAEQAAAVTGARLENAEGRIADLKARLPPPQKGR
jgi:septal ring factor EnvC (AmiA/AmiB activator)